MKDFILTLNSDIIAVLLTTLIAIFAWIFTKIIVSPIHEAKETFFRFTEKRIENLCEILNVLLSIALSPSDKWLRKRLKNLSVSSKMAYLNQKDNEAIIKIASENTLDEIIVLQTITNIQKELAIIISEIQKDNRFYINYSAISPWEKILSYIKLSLQLVLSITIIGLIVFMIIKLIEWNVILGGIISIIIILAIIITIENRNYIKKL